jgi:hypothetical protein
VIDDLLSLVVVVLDVFEELDSLLSWIVSFVVGVDTAL